MTRLQVTIKNWNAVAKWKWDVPNEDICGICRSPYDSACPQCRFPGDDCPLIVGHCKHCFHMHCLLKWIASPSSQQQCPMDRKPWVTASD
ncbi:hypothetical protein MIR68_006374 [Amoeboaphelidium protococcarum]|nr:hypothetical protein MIR68_006374 [Amoeboaphelidium protococcarum]